jgi:predicted dehydrogenase
VASAAGVSGLHVARKFGFEETTTEAERLFGDPATEAVVITTRHDSHAQYVLRAIEAGKHVFVEKPLCLTTGELVAIEAAVSARRSLGASVPMLMVGFNRRFAPHVQRIRKLLSGTPGPKAFVMTVNAGAIPAEHWTQDSATGGGRILGEACHFIDLLRFLADAPIARWERTDMESPTSDTVSLQLRFANGSLGTIHYFANGSKAFPKERLEVFAAGRVLQLDNFRKLVGFGWPGFSGMKLWRQDKGQKECVQHFINAMASGGPSPIPLEDVLEVSRLSIEIAGARG